MRARSQVLLSLCVPLFALSAACTDAVGPVTIPGDPALLQSVTLSPTEATLTAGSHLAIHATALRADGQPATVDTITWASSNTKVATVSASGDVMAVAPGSATITAAVGDITATAPFTIVAAPVESVTVTPKKIDVTVGDSVQFSAQVGGEVTGSGVKWESSNSKVATVSSDGIVRGVTAGTASIRATFSGRTAQSAVSVVAPPKPVAPPVDSQPPVTTPPDSVEPPTTEPPSSSEPGGEVLWSHQPASFSTITNQSWKSLSSRGWDVFDHGYDHVHVVPDPTAPAGDSHVLEFEYPRGYSGGGYGPGVVRYRFSADEMYLGFYWKLSPNWQGHSTGVNKVLYIFQREGANREAVFLVARGAPGGPYHLQISNEASDGGKWFTQNVNNVTVVPGQWYKVELHLRRSSADAAPDGLVEWWVDGQLAARYPNAKLRGVPFSEVHIDPVWGGVDNTISKTHNDYQRFGRIYISAR